MYGIRAHLPITGPVGEAGGDSDRVGTLGLTPLTKPVKLASLLYATPALSAASLFGSCGARLTERVTDVFMGERRYTEEVDRRISLLRKLCKWGQRQARS